MHYKQLTAIIHKEDDIYVSLCTELDIARIKILRRPRAILKLIGCGEKLAATLV
jgi:hypothetical protein